MPFHGVIQFHYMTEYTPEALAQQIESLQQQLQTARERAGQDTNTPYERQEVHAVVGEQIQQQIPTYQSTSVPSASTSDVPSYHDPALAQQVQSLVNVAFTQSVDAAISQAMKTHNPALIDALHDVLADQLHDELVKRQKIESAV